MSENYSVGDNYKVRDLSQAEAGRMRIDWAESRMPVMMKLCARSTPKSRASRACASRAACT
jgi:S-adenosylhomocysteine hydrolase